MKLTSPFLEMKGVWYHRISENEEMNNSCRLGKNCTLLKLMDWVMNMYVNSSEH